MSELHALDMTNILNIFNIPRNILFLFFFIFYLDIENKLVDLLHKQNEKGNENINQQNQQPDRNTSKRYIVRYSSYRNCIVLYIRIGCRYEP